MSQFSARRLPRFRVRGKFVLLTFPFVSFFTRGYRSSLSRFDAYALQSATSEDTLIAANEMMAEGEVEVDGCVGKDQEKLLVWEEWQVVATASESSGRNACH
jgi:hypothetical protein